MKIIALWKYTQQSNGQRTKRAHRWQIWMVEINDTNKQLRMQNSRKNVKQKTYQFIAGTHTKLCSLFNKEFGSSLGKWIHTYHMFPQSHSKGFIPVNWNLFSRKSIYTNVNNTFIWKFQNLELIKMSFNSWTNKWTGTPTEWNTIIK